MYTNLSTISIFFSDLSCDHIWDIFFLFVIFYSLSSLPYFLLSLSLLHTQVHYNTWPCHIFLCTIYIFLYHQQYRKNDLFQSKVQFLLFYDCFRYVIVLCEAIINENWATTKTMQLAETQHFVLQLIGEDLWSRLLVWSPIHALDTIFGVWLLGLDY